MGFGALRPSRSSNNFSQKRGIPHQYTPHPAQKILTFNPDISFQFGTKSQIAAHYPVYREGRRILNFQKSFPKFSNRKISIPAYLVGKAESPLTCILSLIVGEKLMKSGF
jgi:hypothetical protein